MQNFKYNLEQINKISQLLNQIEIKGRQNIITVETIFQILEQGENIIEEGEED